MTTFIVGQLSPAPPRSSKGLVDEFPFGPKYHDSKPQVWTLHLARWPFGPTCSTQCNQQTKIALYQM